MTKDTKTMINYLHKLKDHFSNVQIVCDKIHAKKNWALNHLQMNVDNYLYRNGIFNYDTALADAEQNHNSAEVAMIKHTDSHWYSNYGIPDQSHDLIKAQIDSWKIVAALNSMVADLRIGAYNEGNIKDLQKEGSADND